MAMTQSNRQKLGKWGEQAAADYLTQLGYQMVSQNHRTPYGEIDIIAAHEGMMVFVEVKTRASDSLGMPEISINPRKVTHLIQSAEYYMQHHSEATGSWRIDVVTVQRRSSDPNPLITHFKNAIS